MAFLLWLVFAFMVAMVLLNTARQIKRSDRSNASAVGIVGALVLWGGAATVVAVAATHF